MSRYKVTRVQQENGIVADLASEEQANVNVSRLLEHQSDYYRVENQHNEMAIFHKDNPDKPISRWWKSIRTAGLLEGTSEYYIAQNQEDKWAIFHKDNPDEPISQWWGEINAEEFLMGNSEYYIAGEFEDYIPFSITHRMAIFHKDHPDTPISQWHCSISTTGLIKGESEYYVAKNQNEKSAIFHKDNPDQPITQWWDEIWRAGIVVNQSDYYMVCNQNKTAIFHKDNPDKPITNWHYYIFPFGLIDNTSEYYAALNTFNSPIQIYHLSNIWEPLYELPNKLERVLLYFNDEFALYLSTQKLIMYDSIAMKNKSIAVLPEDMQNIIQSIYKNSASYDINVKTTYKLISNYIHRGFLPIAIYDNKKRQDYHYLFTTEGQYVEKFDDEQNLIAYMKQEISKKYDTSFEMMRLY